MSFVLLCCEKEGEIASEVGERTKLKKENTYVWHIGYHGNTRRFREDVNLLWYCRCEFILPDPFDIYLFI